MVKLNILITGGGGFIGKSIYEGLKQQYHVLAPSHNELDLLNLTQLCDFIINNKIDCIIHAAILIARKDKLATPEMSYYNLQMFENIIHASRKCKYFINFGAGSEFGTYPIDNISMCKEDDLFNKLSTECGGVMKSIISKRMLHIKQPTCFNLRVAGCFGQYEKNDRFIKSNIFRAIKGEPINIHQNRLMDFIYIDDLLSIVKFILNNPDAPKDINCTYIHKYTLYDIANIIMNVTDRHVPITIEKIGMDSKYTLDNTRLASLNIPMVGLPNGIQQMYRKMIECPS